MLTLNDIGAARLLYERAAKAGNSRAATGVGKTYDAQGGCGGFAAEQVSSDQLVPEGGGVGRSRGDGPASPASELNASYLT